MDKKRIEVTIFNETIFLLSSENESHLKKVSEYVDGKMTDIFKTKKISAEKPAINCMLVGLNIANDLFKEREKNAELLKMTQSDKKQIQDASKSNKKIIDEKKLDLSAELNTLKDKNARLENENKQLRYTFNKKNNEFDVLKKEFDDYLETFEDNTNKSQA